MKTTILTIFTALTLVSGIATSTYAASPNKENVTVLKNISRINKIEVHGNVELYVSDGTADQVKVYNKYYSESALVQSENGILRISSYTAEKLVVWVTAYDLRAISAYDNSVVKSFGDLSKIEFDVNLFNNASANLDLKANSANITLNDRSKANVNGSAEDYNLKYSQSASINQTGFAALRATKTLAPGGANAKTINEDLAGL